MTEWIVSASTDDCSRVKSNSPPGDWSLTSASNSAGGYDLANRLGCGLRFTGITINQGVTIDGAYLIIRMKNTKSGSGCKTRISAEDVDNAPTFADDAAAFDTRWAARTTARVDWDISYTLTVNGYYPSTDIKAVIQEIVDRPGWVSGNAIVIFWDDFDDRSPHEVDNWREALSYNSGDGSDAPKLIIPFRVISGDVVQIV